MLKYLLIGALFFIGAFSLATSQNPTIWNFILPGLVWLAWMVYAVVMANRKVGDDIDYLRSLDEANNSR